MSAADAGAAPEDPLWVAGDGLLHDGYRVHAAYRGRLIGVECEFFVVDAESFELRDAMATIERHSQYGGRVKPEIIRQQIELCSNAFESIRELELQLRADLVELLDLLDGVGATLLPVALYEQGDPIWTADPRLAALQHHLGEPFRTRAGTIAADQINLGADDEADAFAIFGRVRALLPEIVGLAASSPFRHGRTNGTACNRLAVYDEAVAALPGMSGIPPPLANLVDYARFLRSQPLFRHPRTCYAYLRPMPHRGVAAEIRCIDKQASLASTLALAALGKAAMLATAALPFAAECSPEAMLAACRHGVVDPARCTALLEFLGRFLPASESPYLHPLLAQTRSPDRQPPLRDAFERSGAAGWHRAVAAAFVDEIRGVAPVRKHP